MAEWVKQNAYTQAFEDFLRSDAERAIVEATEHRPQGQGLWVILFDDGRWTVDHAASQPAGERWEQDKGPFISFPVEPLGPDELDAAHPEDSRFGRAIDTLWERFRAAHAAAVHPEA